MKRKFAAIIMVLLMTFSVAVMSGCSNDGADGNPDQPPATEGDNSLGEDLKDDADKAGDDISYAIRSDDLEAITKQECLEGGISEYQLNRIFKKYGWR